MSESSWIDRAARAGLVSFGVVHVVMGWLAVTLAFGERQGSASTTGAFQELAEKPLGGVLVWAVAVGLVLLAGWQGLEAAVGHEDEDGATRVRKRLTSAAKAAVYLVIAGSAVAKVTGSSGGKGGTDSMTAKLLDLPGGQLLVGLVGLGVVAVGVVLWVAAWRESYLDRLSGEGRSGETGTAYRWAGRIGHVAKGAALGVVGVLFCLAAATHEAKKSGGLDQALRALLDQPLGPALVAATGAGLAAYGLFCFAWARHLDR